MPKTSIIRVLLADDHAMVRQGLAQLLQDSERIQVIGQASDGLSAVTMAKELQPDVLVLDYTMPVMDGVTAVEEIRRNCPITKVLVLTVHENVHYALQVLKAGAHGFVVKAAAVQELVAGILSVYAGRVYVSPTVSEKMIVNLATTRTNRTGIDSLSAREFELLRLLVSGTRLQDCAKLMRVTQSTASTYRARLMEKLGLTSNAELIRFALEKGIEG
jgi:DNA-binding NarL/FixJ family response regulator